MHTKIKRLWADTLDSERFTQGTDYLKGEYPDAITKHCCLGVLCELAKEAGISIQDFRNDAGDELPPSEVIEWANLGDENPRFELLEIRDLISKKAFDYLTGHNSRSSVAISDINDSELVSFPEIAAIIRRKL